MRILIAAILSLSLFLLCNTPQEGEIDKKTVRKWRRKTSEVCWHSIRNQ